MYKTFQKILSHRFFFNEPVLHWLKTELSYTSNHIEGNTLTKRETTLAIEEGITSTSKPIKYYIEVQNHAKAFDYIVSLKDAEITSYEAVILKIHELILNGINDADKGKYRDVRVRIADSNAVLPNPLKVPDLMNNFCKMLDRREDTILKAVEAHYKLVEIHPFIDGNGRTARLLMALILLRANIIPLIIQPRERKRYLYSINKRNTNGHFLQYYKYMLKQLLKTAETIETLFGVSDTVAETDKLLKISEFAKLCGVPVSTIRYYLRTKKLNPVGRTNAGYMLFTKEQKGLVGKK